MTQLRACEGCSRHVYVTEKVCPFCSAVLAEAPQRSFGDRLRRGMSRAQLLAVAAAVGGQALGGCSDTPQNDGYPGGQGSQQGDGDGDSGAGGGAGTMSGGAGGMGGAGGTMSGGMGGAAGTMSGGAGGMGGAGGAMGQPVYGAPVDSGVEDAAADSGEDDMMIMPLYGGAPIPDPVP